MNHNTLRKYICALILFSAIYTAQAQDMAQTIVNADSTITFSLDAPQAKEVKVISDCLVREPDNSWFGGRMRKHKMYKDADGTWTYTTKRLTPEVYNYRFIVDGSFIEDPTNKDSTYVLLHKESVIAVGGSEQADLYLERADNAYHGRIDTLDYFNEEQNITRKVLVYVPCIGANNGDMPIVYLLHGISGDEASWIEAGRVNHILDNLIANGTIKPMLVVMPDCNVPQKLNPKQRTNLLRNMFNYPTLMQGDFEKAFLGLHEFVCRTYPVAQDKFYHAIAGLSSGAKQTANIVRDNSELFAIVGLFSPVVGKKQLPTDKDEHFEVFIGKNDLFYKNGLHFSKRLLRAKVSTRLHESQSAHTWISWRNYVTQFFLIVNEIWSPKNDNSPSQAIEQISQPTDSVS